MRSASERDALTRSLQTALNRVGCYPSEIDGQWGAKGRTALAQFAKLTKLDLATQDEPSMGCCSRRSLRERGASARLGM